MAIIRVLMANFDFALCRLDRSEPSLGIWSF